MAKKATQEEEDKYAEIRAKLRKKYGETAAPTAEELIPRPMPTGIIELDNAIGIGGVPRGRIIDVYGEEAVGKTALFMIIAKTLLERDPTAQIAWLDLEHKLSPSLAKIIGLDLNKILVIHPPSAEAAFDSLLDLIGDFDDYRNSKGRLKSVKPLDTFDLVIFDSVAAAVAEAELLSEVGDVNIAKTAIIMSETLRKIVHPLFSSRTVCAFINQMRSQPMMRTYGNQKNEKPTGGKALKFYASVRLEIMKSEYVKEAQEIVGLKNKIVVAKNGVAEPFHEANYTFSFRHGIDYIHMLIEEALLKKVIALNGSYFSFGEGDDAINWLGKPKLMEAFRNDPALQAKLSAILKR